MQRALMLGLLTSLAACTGVVGEVAPIEDASVTVPEDAGAPYDAGEVDAGGDDAGTPDGGDVDAGEVDGGDVDAGVVATCWRVDAGNPQPTGTTRTLSPGQTLKSVLLQSAPGDRVVVSAGSYANETIDSRFTADVFVEADRNAVVTFAGLRLTSASHLVFRGLALNDTFYMSRSDNIRLERVDIDLGTQDKTALQIANGSAWVTVIDSRVVGGARTIFMSGSFGPSMTWNNNLTFSRNEFVCGSRNCFQLSGARDTVIDDNHFHDPIGDGVLMAGATRISVTRNRMFGVKTVQTTAVRLATPGREWDNYAGVEHMITSDCVVANNLIVSWGRGAIETAAARDIVVANNTAVDTVGFRTWYRTPHDQQDNVIITGNTNLFLWNNIFPSISVQSPDPMPMQQTNLIGGSVQFQDTVNYVPVTPGPAIDAATPGTNAPVIDRLGRHRGAAPDIGAVEVDAPPCL